MGDSKLVLALFLLVGATKINGADLPKNVSIPDWAQFPPRLGQLTPPGVKIKPNFLDTPPQRASSTFGGRLPTPAEGCGVSNLAMRTSRIVGGGPARSGAWPWMVLLGYRPPPHLQHVGVTFNCGGSLITSRHVLSAAHCILNGLWFARLGEHDIRTTNDGQHQDILIVDAKRHNQYNPRLLVFDIAIVYLKHDVTFNDRIRPICLPINPPLQSASVVATYPFVIGWGVTSQNSQQSPLLKQVQVPVIDIASCKERLRRVGALRSDSQISPMVVCAGMHAGQDSCNGDSGGPLMIQEKGNRNGKNPFYQIGIVSWGIPCAKPLVPTVYSSTQFFGKWIQSMLR